MRIGLDHLNLQNMQGTPQARVAPKENSFGEVLKEAVNNTNHLQIKADQSINDYVAGNHDNLHEVMITAEEAKLSLQLLQQVRNKIIEAYQEIARMQI